MVRDWLLDFLKAGAILPSPDNRELWLGWGEPRHAARPEGDGFWLYCPDFFLEDPTPWLGFPYSRRITQAQLATMLTEKPAVLRPQVGWEAAEQSTFVEAFQELQGHFAAEKLKKGVPVVFEEAELAIDPSLRGYLLSHLLEKSQGFPLYVYGFWHAREGLLGATPEFLFSRSETRRFKTGALAGTRPKGDHRISLIEDEKEMSEHQWVIQGILESIGRLGGARVGQTIEIELPSLYHLYTPIEVTLFEGLSFCELVEALHPTPALGAFPKSEGQAWLKSWKDRADRRRFGAPFGGIWNREQAHCLVAIRNIQWHSVPQRSAHRVKVGAGCGIIPQSQLDQEWREIHAKLHSVRSMLGL